MAAAPQLCFPGGWHGRSLVAGMAAAALLCFFGGYHGRGHTFSFQVQTHNEMMITQPLMTMIVMGAMMMYAANAGTSEARRGRLQGTSKAPPRLPDAT